MSLPTKTKLQNVTEFFTMEINFNSLKEYLSNLVVVINQQGKNIQDLQQQIIPKCLKKEVSESFQKISELSNINNPDLLRLLSQHFMKASTKDDDYTNNTNNVANKMGMYGDALAIVFNKFIQQENRVNDLEQKLQQKSEKVWVKDKIQNCKEKIEKNFNTELNVFKKKIDEISQQCNKQISDLSTVVKESEKKTLWTIAECNKIAAQKANREYVDSACILLEEKLKKEIKQNQADSFFTVNKSIDELQYENQKILKLLEEQKARSLKSIEQMKKELLLQFTTLDQFDQKNKDNQEQFLLIQRDIMKINGKGDPAEYYQKSMDIINILQDKIKKIDFDNIKFNSQLESLMKQIEQSEQKASSNANAQSSEHQPGICMLEAKFEMMQHQFEQYTKMIQNTESDLRQKYNILEMGVQQKLDLYRRYQEEQKPIILSDILEYVNKFISQLDDKISLFKNQVVSLDKNLKKNQSKQNDILIKMNDIDLVKIYNLINSKSDQNYILNEFKMHSAIIDGLDNSMKQQKIEFESMEKLYKQLKFLIQNGGVETIKSMVSHRITKIRCTMCSNEQEQRFSKNKEWPNDPNYKDYYDNDQNKVCESHEKQQIIDLTKKEIEDIYIFNQENQLGNQLILPGDVQVRFNKTQKN